IRRYNGAGFLRTAHDKTAETLGRRSEDSRRARKEGPLAFELDHPSCEPPSREQRRAEGRRPPGLIRLARRDHDGALFPCAAAAGSRRGEAARVAELPCDPVPARQTDAREA